MTFPALPGARVRSARARNCRPRPIPQSRTYRVKLTLTQPGTAVRLGMTGDATLGSLDAWNHPAPTRRPFKVPATAIFHRGRDPGGLVVIRPGDSTLELRPVTVGSYGESAVLVDPGGFKDNENIVLAGVHTVYAGQQVTPVKPLFRW